VEKFNNRNDTDFRFLYSSADGYSKEVCLWDASRFDVRRSSVVHSSFVNYYFTDHDSGADFNVVCSHMPHTRHDQVQLAKEAYSSFLRQLERSGNNYFCVGDYNRLSPYLATLIPESNYIALDGTVPTTIRDTAPDNAHSHLPVVAEIEKNQDHNSDHLGLLCEVTADSPKRVTPVKAGNKKSVARDELTRCSLSAVLNPVIRPYRGPSPPQILRVNTQYWCTGTRGGVLHLKEGCYGAFTAAPNMVTTRDRNYCKRCSTQLG
jgi:hypothetical protein